MREALTSEEIVEGYMRALADVELPEVVWKEIAKVNALVLKPERASHWSPVKTGLIERPPIIKV